MDDLIIDLSRRTPMEWAEIYKLKLYSPVPMQLWTEFEWAYNLTEFDYQYIEDEYSEEMELRGLTIKSLIFQYADATEKSILKDKYIETDWIRRQLI